MFVDITEFRPDGRVSLRPGVDLAAAVPEREARNRVMSALVFARGPATLITEDGAARIVITRTRNRPPKGGAVFAIRVRPKTGPAGAYPLRDLRWLGPAYRAATETAGGPAA